MTWYRLAPPEDWDWKEWKLHLDELYRFHTNHGHIIALNILDYVYTQYQKGRRTIEMIELVSEVDYMDVSTLTSEYVG